MHFETGDIYHIYNQGNNRQRIFFDRENYLFFLRKMREHLLPHVNILAYCLMPNHFHWMVEIVSTHTQGTTRGTTHGVTHGRTHGVTLSHPVSNVSNVMSNANKPRILNDSIAILLRSYTRAINKQQNRSGNLFREATKAESLTATNGITPSFYNTKFGTRINTHYPEDEYLQICFNYIHQNPVKAGLANKPEDWEFSSFKDCFGLRNGTLVDKKRCCELELNFNSRGNFESPRE